MSLLIYQTESSKSLSYYFMCYRVILLISWYDFLGSYISKTKNKNYYMVKLLEARVGCNKILHGRPACNAMVPLLSSLRGDWVLWNTPADSCTVTWCGQSWSQASAWTKQFIASYFFLQIHSSHRKAEASSNIFPVSPRPQAQHRGRWPVLWLAGSLALLIACPLTCRLSGVVSLFAHLSHYI